MPFGNPGDPGDPTWAGPQQNAFGWSLLRGWQHHTQPPTLYLKQHFIEHNASLHTTHHCTQRIIEHSASMNTIQHIHP